jgi:hypothetical protein
MKPVSKKIYVVIIVVSELFLIWPPARALAQGNTWVGGNLAQMVEAARWRFGLLRANAALEINNFGYDTDIYYGYLEEPVPDWTFSAGVPVQVLIPLSKKIVVDLSDKPEYLFYYASERERALNNAFRGQVHFALNRVYIQAGGGINDVRRRYSLELDVNVREKRYGLDSMLLWQASRLTSFALISENVKYKYGEEEYLGTSFSELQNREERFFDLITYFQANSDIRLSLDAQYGTYAFTGEASSVRNSKSYGIFIGIDFVPGIGEVMGSTGIRGALRLGYTRLDVIDPELIDGSGYVGEADVSIDLTKKTSVRVFFSKGFEFSIFSSATYYTSTNYGAGLLQDLTRKTTLSYDLSLGITTYPEVTGIQEAGTQFTTHMFRLNLSMGRDLALSMIVTLGNRSVDQSGLTKNRNFFGFSLVYGSAGIGILAPGGALRR